MKKSRRPVRKGPFLLVPEQKLPGAIVQRLRDDVGAERVLADTAEIVRMLREGVRIESAEWATTNAATTWGQRWGVYATDKMRCFFCQRVARWVLWTQSDDANHARPVLLGERNRTVILYNVDHMLPQARGGEDADNLVTSCQRCNSAKQHRRPTADELARFGQRGKNDYAAGT